MQNPDDCFRNQIGQFVHSSYHGSHMLINPANQPHDIGKTITAASPAMYAQGSGPMAGAASQHHQLGASPATSMVQSQQINSRMINSMHNRSVSNPMGNIPRNAISSVVSQGPPQPSHYPQMQMMQPHMHGPLQPQSIVFQAISNGLYPPRSVQPQYTAQQQFSQVYLPQCYNFQTTNNAQSYYPHPPIQPYPTPMNSIPASAPMQSEVTKRKKVLISIVDPSTGHEVQLTGDKSETSSMTDDQKSRSTGANSTIVQQFAAQVAAVANPDALPPSADSIGETTSLQYPPQNEVVPINDRVDSGTVLTPEICDQYATEGIVNSHETSSVSFSKSDNVEVNSISNDVQEADEIKVDSQPIDLGNSSSLTNHNVMRSTDGKSPNESTPNFTKDEESSCLEENKFQSSAEELEDTNYVVSKTDNVLKLVGESEVDSEITAANSAAAVFAVKAATTSVSSQSPQSESIDSVDASPSSDTQQIYSVVLDGNANDVLKVDKASLEGKKGKSKKKKEINKKGESKEGSEMDAFYVGMDTSTTPVSSQSPAGLAQQDTTPISVQAVASATQDKIEPEDEKSSIPSPQQKSPEVFTVTNSNDNIEDNGIVINDKLLPDSSDISDGDVTIRNRDENENIKPSVAVENDKTNEKDKEDKLEENTESVPHQDVPKAGLSLPYKEGQWSPINPDGKKLYDRDFLLQLQAQPISLKKPNNLPNLDVIRDKAQIHKLTETVARVPIPSAPIQARNFADQFLPTFARSGPQRLPVCLYPSLINCPHGSINRRSQPGKDNKQKKVISFSSSLNQAVKLHEADNAWKPTYKVDTDEGENVRTQDLYKRVRGILNKLTPQKFDTLVKQVKDLDINNEERLKGVIDLVFEKAIDEPNFSVPYASMCKQLALVKVPLTEGEGHVNFRKLLLTKCQKEFEQDKSEELNRVEKKKVIEACTTEDKKKQLQEEYEEEESKYRRRQLGNIRFIGELFKMEMLIEPIMHECVKKLLSQGDEDSLECLCRLLTTIGQELVCSKKDNELDSKKDIMNTYMAEMQKIVDRRQTSSRVRFMLQDVIDLKKRNWVPRREVNNPKTIDQIHKEAEKEAQEQQQLLQNMPFAKRMPDDRRKSSSSGPYSGRGSDHDVGGWSTVSKSSKPNVSVDTTRLQLTRPAEVDNIQLGPGSGRGFANWGKGSSGGGKVVQHTENKLSAAHVNRFSVLEQPPYPAFEARRSSQRSAASSRESSRGRSSQAPPPIRKTPSVSKERENLLETVNKMSRVTQQETKSLEQKVPDVQNVNGKDNSATVLKGEVLSRDEIEKKVKPIIDEFLHNSDFEEATRCIIELASPSTMSMIIIEAINQVLERSSQTRCMFGKLLSDLITSKVITMEQCCKGFHAVLELVDEYALDIPKIWEYLGEIIEPITEGSATNLNYLKDILQPCIPSMSAGRLVSAALHCAAAKRGTIKVGEMWRESGSQWEDFLPNNADISSFIASNKLDFTITPVKSQPANELSSPEVMKQIQFMLNSNDSNEALYDWIESNIGEENMYKPTFVRALVTCIIEHVISVTGQSNNLYDVDIPKMKQLSAIIIRYVENRENLQLQTLYAAQSVVAKLNQPKGLLKQLFDCFYDDDVIPEDSFKKWEESDDPAEREGKGVAVASVSSFFTWLKEAEAESLSEDDPSS